MDEKGPNLMMMAIIQYLRDVHPQLSILQYYDGVKVTNISGVSFYINTDPYRYVVHRRNKHEDKRMLLQYSEHNVFNIIQLAIDILF